MARIDESGQWIVLMGILVSIGIFFLAFIINQTTLVGQTTAEGVMEFPKNEIQDTRSEVFRWMSHIDKLPESKKDYEKWEAIRDMTTLARYRRNAEIWFDIYKKEQNDDAYVILIHYNNGMTDYCENCENRLALYFPEK